VFLFFPTWKIQCHISPSGNGYLTNDISVRWQIEVDDNPLAATITQRHNAYIIAETNTRSDTFSFVANMTFVTMYTSTIFVLGSTVANALKVQPEQIWVIDMPDASQIVKICEAIMLARADEDLENEMM